MTDLVRLRELLESATPGEWEPVLADDPRGQPSVMYGGLVCLVKHDGTGSMAVVAESDFVSPIAWEANTRLIPALKNAAPALLTAAEECERMRARIEKMEKALSTGHDEHRVLFYERDFYVLSNFSAFRVRWHGIDFDTSEHAYHWTKFDGNASHHPEIQRLIRQSRSAHEAFKIAEEYKASRRTDWEAVKLNVMHNIVAAKVQQHEYVRRKLLATGDRELIEDSWRDDFWGWGPNKDGANHLGKIWMQIRAELRSALSQDDQ